VRISTNYFLGLSLILSVSCCKVAEQCRNDHRSLCGIICVSQSRISSVERGLETGETAAAAVMMMMMMMQQRHHNSVITRCPLIVRCHGTHQCQRLITATAASDNSFCGGSETRFHDNTSVTNSRKHSFKM